MWYCNIVRPLFNIATDAAGRFMAQPLPRFIRDLFVLILWKIDVSKTKMLACLHILFLCNCIVLSTYVKYTYFCKRMTLCYNLPKNKTKHSENIKIDVTSLCTSKPGLDDYILRRSHCVTARPTNLWVGKIGTKYYVK